MPRRWQIFLDRFGPAGLLLPGTFVAVFNAIEALDKVEKILSLPETLPRWLTLARNPYAALILIVSGFVWLAVITRSRARSSSSKQLVDHLNRKIEWPLKKTVRAALIPACIGAVAAIAALFYLSSRRPSATSALLSLRLESDFSWVDDLPSLGEERVWSKDLNETLVKSCTLKFKIHFTNTSPDHRLSISVVALNIDANSGVAMSFVKPSITGCDLDLAPEEHCEGTLAVQMPATDYRALGTTPHKKVLRIQDRISGRFVDVQLPGKYPPAK